MNFKNVLFDSIWVLLPVKGFMTSGVFASMAWCSVFSLQQYNPMSTDKRHRQLRATIVGKRPTFSFTSTSENMTTYWWWTTNANRIFTFATVLNQIRWYRYNMHWNTVLCVCMCWNHLLIHTENETATFCPLYHFFCESMPACACTVASSMQNKNVFVCIEMYTNQFWNGSTARQPASLNNNLRGTISFKHLKENLLSGNYDKYHLPLFFFTKKKGKKTQT